MIVPTPGRVVWYHPKEAEPGYNATPVPLAATVAYAHSDTCVNLAIIDREGNPFQRTSVLLWQGEGARPPLPYAEWMPYQKAVASGQQPPTLHAK